MGDESSVKVPFTTAIRPISARPGEIKKICTNPGPQDYGPVEVNKFKKRSSVIPEGTFTTAGKDLESIDKSRERAKSPGPNNYRPQSAAILSRNPSATIGNTKRSF